MTLIVETMSRLQCPREKHTLWADHQRIPNPVVTYLAVLSHLVGGWLRSGGAEGSSGGNSDNSAGYSKTRMDLLSQPSLNSTRVGVVGSPHTTHKLVRHFQETKEAECYETIF